MGCPVHSPLVRHCSPRVSPPSPRNPKPPPLPQCDQLEEGDAGGVDCGLDAGPNSLFFDYDLTDGAGSLVLTQFTPRRRKACLVTRSGSTASGHWRRDCATSILDGADDLFIPVSESMVNNTFMVGNLMPTGSISPRVSSTDTGSTPSRNRGELIIATERLNAATYVESARLLDRDGFIHLYDMRIDYAARECTLVDPNGVMAAGLNDEALIAECMQRDWE